VSGSVGVTVETGDRRFRDPRLAHLYPAWRASGEWVVDEFFVTQPGICVDHVGLRLHPVRHRYDCFGTSIAHDVYCQRASVRARDRRTDSAVEPAC